MAAERLAERLNALRSRLGGDRRSAGAAVAGAPRLSAREDGLRAEPVGVEAYLPGEEVQVAAGAYFLHRRVRSELDKGRGMFLRRLAPCQQRTRTLDCHPELAELP